MFKRKKAEPAPPRHGKPVEVIGLEVMAEDGMHLYRKKAGDPVVAAPESLESMGFGDEFCGPVDCPDCTGGGDER